MAARCETIGRQLCLRDTAYAESRDGVTTVDRDWIVFGNASDSIDVLGDDGSLISTNVGTDHDAARNNVSYFHGRLAHDGVVVITVSYLDRGSVVPYELRIRRQSAVRDPGFTPTGKWARFTIISAKPTDAFTVIPLSRTPAMPDAAAWTVMAIPYNVVLSGDSLYQVCRLPCVSPDTVVLREGARLTKRY